MAASLVLDAPWAYAGLIMIAGCFAHDDLPPGCLAGMPVLFCRGGQDMVIPRTRSDAALAYLAGPSDAVLRAVDYGGDHEITRELIGSIASWFNEQSERNYRRDA